MWKSLMGLVENGNAFTQSTQEIHVNFCPVCGYYLGHGVTCCYYSLPANPAMSDFTAQHSTMKWKLLIIESLFP